MTDTNGISRETLTMYEMLWGEEYNPEFNGNDNKPNHQEKDDANARHPQAIRNYSILA